MIVDVRTNSISLNPNLFDYETYYFLEPDDPKDSILVLLYSRLTFNINKDGSYKTSVLDFFIFKDFISKSNLKISINLTDKALDILKRFLEYRGKLMDIKMGVFNTEINTSLKTKPYEDQKSAIKFFLELKKSLNCSSVGIGKTLCALGTFNILRNQNKVSNCLVITLNQVKLEWNREIPKHTNYSYRIIGNGSKNVLKDLDEFNEDILVVHYDIIINDLVKTKLISMGFDFWIIDEAHTLRNVQSQRSESLFEVFETTNPTYLNMLTGTPVSNSPENAQAILRYICPKIVPGKVKFQNHFCNYILIKPKGMNRRIPILNKSKPYKNLNELNFMMDMCSFRKTHADVKDFPQTVISIKDVEMEKDQEILYNKIKNETYMEIAKMPEKAMNLNMVMVKTWRLRQAISHPAILGEYKTSSAKFKVLDNLLDEVLSEPDSKVVLFSCHRETLELLVHKYKDQYGARLFAGVGNEFTDEMRKENNTRFFDDSNSRMLCAMTSLAVGGNWGQVARTGIFVDLPIIPTDWKQSMGRITRRDAKGISSIIALLCANTVDDWVWKLLDTAKQVTNEIIKGDNDILIDKDDLIKELKK